MSRLLLLFLTLWTHSAFGGDPPFSHIYRKPSLSPYILLAPEIEMPYHMGVKPLIQQEKQEIKLKKNANAKQSTGNSFNDRWQPQQRTIRDTGHNSSSYMNGIRPTGHATYFMYKPHYDN